MVPVNIVLCPKHLETTPASSPLFVSIFVFLFCPRIFCLCLYNATNLNFHSSSKESFNPSLSLPSQRRQVCNSSLRILICEAFLCNFKVIPIVKESLHCELVERLLAGSWSTTLHLLKNCLQHRPPSNLSLFI